MSDHSPSVFRYCLFAFRLPLSAFRLALFAFGFRLSAFAFALVALGAETPYTNYFPLPESQGGWRVLQDPDAIRRVAGMDPVKLEALKEWLRQSDQRTFAA